MRGRAGRAVTSAAAAVFIALGGLALLKGHGLRQTSAGPALPDRAGPARGEGGPSSKVARILREVQRRR